MRWMVVALALTALACGKKPEQSKLPNGEASGHEIPDPVDDGVLLDTEEQPAQPDLK